MRFVMYADGRTILCSQQILTILMEQTKIHCSMRGPHGERKFALASVRFGSLADAAIGL